MDHLPDLLVCHVLSKLSSNLLQILKGDPSLVIQVELTESAHGIFLGVLLAHLYQEQLEELAEVNGARGGRPVYTRDHLLHFFLPRLEPERAKDHLEGARVDHTLTVGVEKVERLPYLDAL
eukprot:CAMPEP_0184381798 /NCGR_PEP_ID=MMETSP0007-20130409/5805_1 /TAXON_ID=97485 /ORGANISM="Prymnesium parvum, Strain Texoma1" /LENGTH=120 /DNA_ID=CAMNT_0026727555 /DNA_START=400 /DNA_END=758 /DNA_ORIENTATION=+